MSFVHDKCIYALSLRGDAHDLPSDMVPCGLRGYYTINLTNFKPLATPDFAEKFRIQDCVR